MSVEAARAWADEHGWETEPAPKGVGGLAFFFTTPAQGRTPEKQHVAMYGDWPAFAERLTSSGLI